MVIFSYVYVKKIVTFWKQIVKNGDCRAIFQQRKKPSTIVTKYLMLTSKGK